MAAAKEEGHSTSVLSKEEEEELARLFLGSDENKFHLPG
jgi:hypothetical protein